MKFILTSLVLSLSVVAFSETSVIDGVTWTYVVKNNEVLLEHPDVHMRSSAHPLPVVDLKGDIKIPDSIDGRPVTAIGPAAFQDVSGVIEIPSTVANIHAQAFLGEFLQFQLLGSSWGGSVTWAYLYKPPKVTLLFKGNKPAIDSSDLYRYDDRIVRIRMSCKRK